MSKYVMHKTTHFVSQGNILTVQNAFKIGQKLHSNSIFNSAVIAAKDWLQGFGMAR